MDYREIRYEVDDHVATITMNAPDRLNAFSLGMLGEMAEAAARAEETPEVRAVVLTGAGRAFSTGGNVKTMGEVAASRTPIEQQTVTHIQRLQVVLRRLSKPFIAAVNGAAYGAGLDLACAADFRIASETATFAEVYVRLGLAPGGGGAWLLPRIVGLTRALDLVLSGERIDAQEALRIGLVSRVVPAADLARTTQQFARRFTSAAPLGVQTAKRAVYRGLDMPFEAALEYMRPQVAQLRQTEDHQEGLRALAERREPHFQGR